MNNIQGLTSRETGVFVLSSGASEAHVRAYLPMASQQESSPGRSRGWTSPISWSKVRMAFASR